MEIRKRIIRLLHKTLLVCLVWFIVALVISSITFLNQLQGNYSKTLSPAGVILFEVACIIPWIVSTPLIVWVTRAHPLEKDLLFRSIPVHLLTALCVFVFHSVVQSYQASVFYSHPFEWNYLKKDFLGFLDMRLLLCAGVVLGIYVIDFQRKDREVRMREPRLKAQLNKVKYQAILNQVQPSFLLDSIDTIRKKVRVNADESEQVLIDFSDLLRIMLQNTERDEVPVQEDLESYHLYVRLLEKRLGTEIEHTDHIDEACYEALVPSYRILIPLVEELLSAAPVTAGNIQGLSYTATCKYPVMHLELNIKGIELPPGSLPDYLEAIRFAEIQTHLKARYGEAMDLKVHIVSHGIAVNFRFPFSIQQKDERLFSELYTTGNSENNR